VTHATHTADVAVDQTDPFFFDHPLDHVPGMLLVCAMADLARGDRGGVPRDGRVRGAVNFRAMPELGPRLSLSAEPAADGRRNMRVTQGSTVVADSWFELTARGEPALPDTAGGAGSRPAGASLVHRVRSENVMIGEPSEVGGQVTADVLAPPDGHTLHGRRPGLRSVRAVIEAGRQLSTLLPHRVGGWPLDIQMLWLKVTADLPVALPAALPVALCWQPTRIAESKARFRFDVIAGEGRKVGSLVYVSMGLHLDDYQRFRADRNAA
jgi:hypothetical protein